MSDCHHEPKVYREHELSPLPDFDWKRPVVIECDLVDLMGLFGALALCLKHPRLGPKIRQRLQELKAQFGDTLVQAGFPPDELDAWYVPDEVP